MILIDPGLINSEHKQLRSIHDKICKLQSILHGIRNDSVAGIDHENQNNYKDKHLVASDVYDDAYLIEHITVVQQTANLNLIFNNEKNIRWTRCLVMYH